MQLSITQKKIVAAGTAIIACLVAFNVLAADKAAAVSTVVAAIAALYAPKETI